MDTILLKNYNPRSSVITNASVVPKAKYPVIDCHTHPDATTPDEVAKFVKTMDNVGLKTVVVLTGATGKKFDELVQLFLKPYPDRFQVWCGLDTTDTDRPDFSRLAVAELERCYRMGARGVGELIDKGSGFRRYSRDRIHPDDPRLDAFWEKCAELKMPVNLHIADHPSCWTPLDDFQERPPSYQHYNQFGRDVPSYEELMKVLCRVLERHPRTTFILAHMANEGNDLQALSIKMDKYPNLYLDISARNYEIGRTPRAAAKFITRYRDRILFGTDFMTNDKKYYEYWWRLLETADEYMNGREIAGVWWMLYGLELPETVLEPLYRGNAARIMNWTKY
jgi:predicted TIM-barrel fold metal-dependent hydrolase